MAIVLGSRENVSRSGVIDGRKRKNELKKNSIYTFLKGC
jgi:hypothetical protein